MKKLKSISFPAAVVTLVLSFGLSSTSAEIRDQRIQPETYTLEAKVVDWVTGDPLANAQVIIVGMKELNTTTKLDGTFRLENLAAGTYTIKVKFDEYQTWKRDITINTNKKVTIKLKPKIS